MFEKKVPKNLFYCLSYCYFCIFMSVAKEAAILFSWSRNEQKFKNTDITYYTITLEYHSEKGFDVVPKII